MRRVLLLAALLIAGNVGSAYATTIGFEDLPLDLGGTNGPGADRVSAGFLFDSRINHSHIDNGTWGTSNGTQFLLIDNVGGDASPPMNNAVTFWPTGGGTFALTSIDLSEAGGAGPGGTCCSTYSHQVVVTGNLFGGGTVSTTLILDFNPITNPSFGFQTFTFDSAWNNLSSVVLEGTGALCCGELPGNYYAIDNVVVTRGVPEPGTLTLLTLGSVFLVRRRRRSRR